MRGVSVEKDFGLVTRKSEVDKIPKTIKILVTWHINSLDQIAVWWLHRVRTTIVDYIIRILGAQPKCQRSIPETHPSASSLRKYRQLMVRTSLKGQVGSDRIEIVPSIPISVRIIPCNSFKFTLRYRVREHGFIFLPGFYQFPGLPGLCHLNRLGGLDARCVKFLEGFSSESPRAELDIDIFIVSIER